MKKRVAFKTIGCRLNQAETAIMAGQFESADFDIVPFGAPCDVAVIHTCTVTATAENKSLRFARSAGKLDAGPIVVLAGCAVEASREKLLKEGFDLVVGQNEKFRLPELLAKQGKLKTESAEQRTPSLSPRLPLFQTTRPLIKVQDGCDFHCAYCIVPRARGAPRSRPATDIIEEIRGLSEAGYREVVLTGANIGRYRDDSGGLLNLIRQVERIDGIKRIRLSSIELSTTEREIIDHMAASEKLCRYMHLPLQSGDSEILTAMGRRYTVGDYHRFVDYALARIPFLGLGADLLVGFPGEDEKAFANTARMVEALPFNNLHVFAYSKRPGVRASRMKQQVSKAEKKRRSAILIALGKKKKRLFAETCVGRKVSVLVETCHSDGSGTGWTGEYIEACVTAPNIEANHIVTFAPKRYNNGVLY